MNEKETRTLSPVVASIILIAVVVAVSIAVAAWMGALNFKFMEKSNEQLLVTIPAYDNATHIWIDDSEWTTQTFEGFHTLPYSFNVSTSSQFNIKVTYYEQCGNGTYLQIGEEMFLIKGES